MLKLNLGCGEDYKKGWINVDYRDNISIDLKHDLNKFPYPFKEDTFDEILMKSVLEHLENPIKTLKELVRISKNNAKITILVPHANSYGNLSNLTHKTNFTENSFTSSLLKEYELENLELLKREFVYDQNKWKKLIPLKKFFKIFLNGIYDDILFEFRVKKFISS